MPFDKLRANGKQAKERETNKTRGIINEIQLAQASFGGNAVMDAKFLSAAAVAELLGISPRAVQKHCTAGKYQTRQVPAKGGKGGVKYEIALASLTSEVQARYTAQTTPIVASTVQADHLMLLHSTALAAPLINDVKADADDMLLQADWAYFCKQSGAMRDKAYAQAKVVLQLKQAIDANAHAALRGVKKVPLQTLMQQIAQANPDVCQSWRTLQNWWLGSKGKAGCCRFDPNDYAPALSGRYLGRVATADCSPEAFEYYCQLYLHRRQPTAADCYRRTVEMRCEKDWQIPSAATLQRRLDSAYAPATIVLLREGEQAMRKLIPFQVRDKSVFRAGEAVSGDGLKFDKLWVQFPDGEVLNTATAWFWQDIYSGKIVAWRLGKTESTDLFRLATYDLTGQFLPSYVQVDNTRVAANKMMTGQSQGRHRFGNQSNDPLGMLLMLGMQVHFTDPDHNLSSPGSKPIERSFGIGGLHDKVALNPKLRDRGYSTATAIGADELREAIGYEVQRHNAQEKRRTAVCKGMLSFDQAFAQSFSSWSPKKLTDNQRQLLTLNIEVVTANRENGAVTLKAGRSQYGGNRYWCTALNVYRGQSVAVFYDPDNLTADVEIYDLDAKHLTTAQYMASVGFTDKDAGQEYRKRVQRIRKLTKKQAKEVQAIQKLHRDKLPALAESEPVQSKVVAGLFKKPLDQGTKHPAPSVINAEEAFARAMQKFGS